MNKTYLARILASLFIGCFLLFGAGVSSRAGEIAPDLQSALQSASSQDEVSIIITLAGKADLSFVKNLKGIDRHLSRALIVSALKSNAQSSRGRITSFLRTEGVMDIENLWIVNSLAATVPADLIEEVADLPGVESVRLDGKMQAPHKGSGKQSPYEWNLSAVHAPGLWSSGITGAGVVVANLDTGVDIDHPDLQDKWRGGTDSWFDPNGQHVSTPTDVNGHGTQTMGIIVGGNSSGTAIGMAPGARWIAAKIYNDADYASYSAIHLAFQWLLDPDENPDTDDAPDVVNISWGLDSADPCDLEFETDIQLLETASIAVASAAGNDGPYSGTSISPANYPESFAVGAVDQNQSIASFSSRGPSACDGSIYPEIVAPGVSVRTSDLTYGGVFPDSYAYVSGTSFSAPHVAGAMALLLSEFPDSTVAELYDSLKQSSSDLGAAGADDVFGYGLLDAVTAEALLSQGQPPLCLDADNDGFYSDAACGTEADCNDADAGIYPGAVEIKQDGIDQDCNGYDLTIDIQTAAYDAKRDSLLVEAASALGKNAKLSLAGYGSMSWNKRSALWTLSVRGVGGNPGSVTVYGIEGSVSIQTTLK